MVKKIPAKRFPGVSRTKGSFTTKGRKFGIVVSEFNEYLTNQLLEGALDTFVRHGAREKDIVVVYVPGAFELPIATRKLLVSKKLDAVIALAVVIRGETKHFDQVVAESAHGIRLVSEASGVPVILGVVPAENVNQAIERVGIKHMNKGREWALSAMEMADLSVKLRKKK